MWDSWHESLTMPIPEATLRMLRRESKHEKRKIKRGYRAARKGVVIRIANWKAEGQGSPVES